MQFCQEQIKIKACLLWVQNNARMTICFKPRVIQPTILSPTVAINKQARVRANQLYIPALSNTFLAISEDQIIAFFN